MEKKDQFKKFISNHPEFAQAVNNKETTFQSLYELYDIYGENMDIWNKYLTKPTVDDFSIKGLLKTLKNIDLNSLEENINSIQKAVSLVEGLTSKEEVKEEKEVHDTNIDKLYSDKNE